MQASELNGADSFPPRIIALVIGIDAYASSPLSGCVSDALAMRRVLIDKFGAAPDEIVTLLAPSASATDLPKFGPATAANLRIELEGLKKRANSRDRVFIYYSGHGGSQRLTGANLRQVESLVPADGLIPGNLIYDHQLNASLAELSEVTPHVTVILDCCHSAGATRTVELAEGGGNGNPSARFMTLPDLSESEARSLSEAPRSPLSTECLVIAACSADELALERTFADGSRHGAFTNSLLTTLSAISTERLATTAWRDIWTSLTAGTAPAQHPQVLGDDARPLSGAASPLLAGDVLVERQGAHYEVPGGTVVDITPGTLIRVLGVIRSVDGGVSEQDCGLLRVSRADTRRAIAEPAGTLSWPAIPRFRIEKLGGPVLGFSLRQQGAQDLKRLLAQLLETCPSVALVDEASADVQIVQDGADWVLCDELFGLEREGRPELARFNLIALRDVLEHAVRYRAPMRVAQRARDLSGKLKLRLLDTTNMESANGETTLDELVLVDGKYPVRNGMTFCFELWNESKVKLHTTLINMAPSGRVQLLDQITLEPGVTQRVWLKGVIGNPFFVTGDPAFERTFAIATTDPAVNLRHLALAKSFRMVSEEAYERGAGEVSRDLGGDDEPRGPRGAEVRWTYAKVIVQSIGKPLQTG